MMRFRHPLTQRSIVLLPKKRAECGRKLHSYATDRNIVPVLFPPS